MTVAVPIFVVRLKLFDTQLALLGIMSIFLRNIVIGSYQHPIGYYISVVIGLLSKYSGIHI